MIIYVTYMENGQVKKGALTEAKINELRASGVQNLNTYPNSQTMETVYKSLINESGDHDNKKFLMD